MIQRLSILLHRALVACAALFEASPDQSVRHVRPRWEPWILCALIAIGAVVRFWGIGSFGLHKPDEDTTALAAVHILEDGTPRFPSGMFYARAIAQSYMIAASIKVFGQTEWAMRFPSAVCGLLFIVLAHFFGRRFFVPVWNMAFVAVVALLPGFIADSQEVRMYGFLIASLAAYGAFIFKWEETDKARYLVAALVAMAIALQFQVLGIFGVFLVLFPGLLHGDLKRFMQGCIAFGVILLTYALISHWNSSFYPTTAKDIQHASAAVKVDKVSSYYHLQLVSALMGAICSALLAWFFTNRVSSKVAAIVARTFTLFALMAFMSLFYHVGALLLIVATVITWRHGGGDLKRAVVLAVAIGVLAAAQLWMLHVAGVGSARKIIGAMVGFPSVWQYLRVGQYSWLAFVSVIVGAVVAIYRLMHVKRIGDYWLLFFLGALAPLFLLGFFDWDVPPRYGEFAVLPLLVCAFACWQKAIASKGMGLQQSATSGVAVATIVALLFINPIALARSVNAGSTFADHRGAAMYIQSLKLGPKDVVIAEEVLLQTYYLGHIDYWLQSMPTAAEFLERVNGQLVDEYTHTPVISSQAELRAVIDRPDRGAIYIVGSGESQEDGRLYFRGQELHDLLSSDQFKVVFVARDGLTKIWKIDAPHAKDGS